MSVTIRDVARLAGVSVATVSRVMNASAPVSDETRTRVLDAAGELRFHPNLAARSLITQRTHALGVILPDLYGEFFSELLRGMDQTAQRHGHHLLVSSSHHEPRGLKVAVHAMHGRVDGMLVMAPDVEIDALSELLPPRLPTVFLNATLLGDKVPDDVGLISVDNFGGAETMTAHLLVLGHRRIGFIAGAERNAEANERERGHRAALAAAGVHCGEELYRRGDFTEATGWRAAEELAELAEPPTAIFCANDAMAIGALSALRTAGVAVPERISVVGFDDIPVAKFLNPPLTSVGVGIAALGERAVTLLLHAIAERAPPRATAGPHVEAFPTTLFVRGSSGPPPPPQPAAPKQSANGRSAVSRTSRHVRGIRRP